MNLQVYQPPLNDYDQLSLKDLVEAQDLYHFHLMGSPNVVATAIGRYRIRRKDDWPSESGPGTKHGEYARTLDNSEVRPYSWPAVLVFVQEWIPSDQFSKNGKYNPSQILPKILYLPDGRRVPVCVIESPRELKSPPTPPIQFPLNNIGGGRPVLARVQGQDHVATIACLVRDGHKIYALTNRHVAGETGEILYTMRQGRIERVGVTAAGQLTRKLFAEIYPGLAVKNTYTNLDIGLIDIDNLDDWTAKVEGIGTIGPPEDLSVHNLSLALIGRQVRGYGAASGLMLGEIYALFYRYKSQGGFDYVADFFIGPRSTMSGEQAAQKAAPPKPAVRQSIFAPQPGDSGTLFLLEPRPSDDPEKKVEKTGINAQPPTYSPLAVQWGAHLLQLGGSSLQSYALATCLSTVCNLLDVDLVRDWNIDQPDTWGSVGHFSIASRVIKALSKNSPKLIELMTQNALIIAPADETIRNDDFKGLGSQDFVFLADVPDFFWKLGHQGHTRYYEGPNHFADMDQKNDNGDDLRTLCQNPENLNVTIWRNFYDSIHVLLHKKNEKDEIKPLHRGLLPFRVWQIFDEMVRFAREGKYPEFVCAAGVLVHYIGDACQPLHISYLYDGDPLRPVTRTVHHQNGVDEELQEPLGIGIHSAYEDQVVNAYRREILDGLDFVEQINQADLIKNGFDAAGKTVELMRKTFECLPPSEIVQTYISYTGKPRDWAEYFWERYGEQTISVMATGTHLVALLWESAWGQGQGEAGVLPLPALTESEAMCICAKKTFLESHSIETIGTILEQH